MTTKMTQPQALQAAKSDEWSKALGGFALVQYSSGRFSNEYGEDDTFHFDYYPFGQVPAKGGEIIAKYRWNANTKRWSKIA